jgi:elongation factor P
MAILQYNEATVHTLIIMEGEPYEVLESRVFRMQQRKPVNATKLRNLISGNVVQHSFGVSDKVEEAELENKPVKYLYNNKGEYWFCDAKDPSKRFKLEHDMLGEGIKFIKANSMIDAVLFREKIIGVKLPVKVELKVVEAPPAVKGDTAKGGSKQIKLETGATINAPLFINEGEIIRVNTGTGDYVERAN